MQMYTHSTNADPTLNGNQASLSYVNYCVEYAWYAQENREKETESPPSPQKTKQNKNNNNNNNKTTTTNKNKTSKQLQHKRGEWWRKDRDLIDMKQKLDSIKIKKKKKKRRKSVPDLNSLYPI